MVAHAFFPELGKQRQANVCNYKASLIYIQFRTSQGYKSDTLSQEIIV